MELTQAQSNAKDTIIKAFKNRQPRFLLTGYAGSGKTTLMRDLCAEFTAMGKEVVVTAPTHKAVAVLRGKVSDEIACVTIHSLLSLKVKNDKHKIVLKRERHARDISCDVIVIDECSMISTDLMGWITRLTPGIFVLFLGDLAQLPPVGEEHSPTFDVTPSAHLDTVIRQAAGNPILTAATALREQQQTERCSFSWVRGDHHDGMGLYCPDPDRKAEWMRRAFLSDAFRENNDYFRYICWTNAQVARVNQVARRRIYGGQQADCRPFMAGERVISRAPVFICEGKTQTQVITTNEEVTVKEIRASVLNYDFDAVDGVQKWSASLPSWKITLITNNADHGEVTAHMIDRTDELEAVCAQLRAEAQVNGERWDDLFRFKGSLLQLQAIYALTAHTSQGSTFKNVFVDVGDIARRRKDNLKEMQQLLYVALTRAEEKVVLVNRGTAQ